MVVAKCSRPSDSDEDVTLVVYCIPSKLDLVFNSLSDSKLVDVKIEFVNVVE